MEKFNDCFTLDNKEPGNVLGGRHVLPVKFSRF
ncbi:hypothetical protein QE409_000223 [Klebsiella sp. SORGH_AS 1173]|nr:hypothetical protein [Klebsiella sp. SORGH_AS_1173]